MIIPFFCNALYLSGKGMIVSQHEGVISFPQFSFKSKKQADSLLFAFEADYGARTRHLNLGKVALYQMS